MIPTSEIISQQGEDPNGWAYFIELFFGIYGNPPQPNDYEFYLNNIGTVWATNNGFNPPGFFVNTEPSINNSIYPGVVENSEWFYWKGWNMCYSRDGVLPGLPPVPAPLYGYGLYKISTNASNEFFYLDYRDTRIPYFEEIHSGHPLDLWIKYDFTTHSFAYSIEGTIGSFVQIVKGQYLPFWIIKQTNPSIPSTIEFQNYWNNCLNVLNNGDNHPRLVWGPYPSSSLSINNYKIYRKYGSSAWSPFVTVSSITFEYTDNSVSLTLPGGQAGVNMQYKIVAIYSNNHETSPTNVVTVNVPGQEIEKISNKSKFVSSEFYSLYQNYSNPFNPVTEIRFSIAENSFISLRIYDMIGKEIEVLVNEERTPGTYSVNFNGLALSSGIYFYKLQTQNFVETKKMILMK